MKLTRRQEEFIVNLVDLTAELEGPIHYSILAERLGVSPFTAYDMLCVLEEKGMVSSEYQLAQGKSGPGRAERLFCPAMSIADRHRKLAARVDATELDDAELKKFMLEKLRSGSAQSRDVAEALLARIPPEKSGDTGYCLEVMTVVALRLREMAGQKRLLTYLPQLMVGDNGVLRNNLVLLGGFALGLLVQEQSSGDHWSQMLLEHVRHYQEIVIGMPPDEVRQLAASLATVFEPLSANHEIKAVEG